MKKSLKRAIVTLNLIANTLDLPQRVRQGTLRKYEYLLDKRLTQGRSRAALISACAYLSCIENDYPVNLKRLCQASECSRKELIRQGKFIKRFIKVNKRVSVESYVNKYCHALGLNPRETTKALSLSNQLRREHPNKKSNLVAGAAVYIVSDNSYQEIAQLTGLSINALFRTCQGIRK